MTTLRFWATALTPVHIGGGALAMEDCLIRDDWLVCFNPHAVLRDMPAAGRHEYQRRIDANDFPAALRLLREHCRLPHHERFRTRLGADARPLLAEMVEHPQQRGDVQPLLRDPHSGALRVPGSSVKGAIRTAVVNAYVQTDLHRVQAAVQAEPDRSKRRWRLEDAALLMDHQDPATDPLRFLKVSDAAAPPDAARLDRITLYKAGKPPRDDGRPLFCERLRSRADEAEPPVFTVEIHLDEDIRQPRTARRIDWHFLAAACNAFYIKRMEAELRQFFGRDKRREARFGAEGLIKWTGERLLIARRIQERGLLLRLGRYSHFESHSVDDLREGRDERKRQPLHGMGGSRVLCETAGGLRVPFGWVVLMREGS